MRVFLSALVLSLFLTSQVFAEPVPGHPDWFLEKVEKEVEEGSYDQSPDFYTLRPKDGRPAISINQGLAAKIKSGQVNPSDIYANNTKEEGANKENESGEEYVYGEAGNSYVQADTIESTLTDSEKSSTSVYAGLGYADESTGLAPLPQQGTSSFGSSSYGGAFNPAGGNSIASGSNNTYSQSSSSNSGASSMPDIKIKSEQDDAVSSAVEAAATDPDAFIENAVQEAIEKEKEANQPSTLGSVASSSSKKKKDKDKDSSTNSDIAINGNNQARGFGVSEKSSSRDPASSEIELKETDKPCEYTRVVYDQPIKKRIKVPKTCKVVQVSAWGAGGGSATYLDTRHVGGRDGGTEYITRTAPGGAGSFVSANRKFNGEKMDLIIVVGAAGGSASGSRVGSGGYPGGGNGGQSSSYSGGGGGGFTGVFETYKSFNSSELEQTKALVIASGGGGASGRGQSGNAGGLDKGQGGSLAGSQGAGGSASGNGENGSGLQGGKGGSGMRYANCQMNNQGQCVIRDDSGDHGGSTQVVPSDYNSAGGGGGGGGYFGGAGGTGAGVSGSAQAGGGGSSLYNKKMDYFTAEPGDGTRPGFYYYPERGNAGEPDKPGKIIVEWY
ncbi:MAG: hypothetical protein M9962_08860 [Oligoflexia bacterium]|nr:hypothetical protein [Oligoflexia bacterium]